MRTKRLITIAVATMFLIGGVAAVGAANPADAATENGANADDGTAPNEGAASNASEDRPDASASADRPDARDERGNDTDGVGPSDGLPEQASDRVGEIHGTIDSFLSGSVENLGSSLSDLLSDDGASENADDAGQNADDIEPNDDVDGDDGDAP